MPKCERIVAYPLIAKRPASRGVVLIIAISIITSVQMRAQSKLANSAWPAFRHNALMTAFTPAKGPAIPAVKWRTNFGSGPLGSPVLAPDGTIYVPGNADGALYAVTPDGVLKWVFAGTDTEKFVAPLVVGEDGTIYFGSTTNIFYAINSNGSLRWRLKLDGPMRFSANIGSDGTIYVAANDCNLYAMTPAGKLKWKVFLGKLPGNGPAIAADGTIYVVAGEFLKGFKPDGSLLFELSNPDMGLLNGLMVEGKELFYVTALEKPFIRAISNTPSIRWEYVPRDHPSFKSSTMPAKDKNGNIYFATTEEGGVISLDHNGNQRWLYTVPGSKNITELVVDDASCIYLVNDQLGLTSLSPNGQLRWSLPEVRCAFSPAIGADGTIYIASEKKLYAIGPQPPRAASLVKLSDNLEACVGTPLDTIRARVLDQYGNVFPGQPVQFHVFSGGGQVTVLNGTTDGNGIARALWTLGLTPGKQELEVASTGLSGSPSILTATAKTPKISGNREAAFDFPEINQFSEKIYFIRNNSECTLRVDSLRIVGVVPSVFSVLAPTFPQTINTGDSLAVRLRFGPTDCDAQAATLRIFSDDPNQAQFDVSLRGAALARPGIAMASTPINFGTICRETTATLSLPISNTGCANLTITNITSTNPAFVVVTPLPVTIPPGGQTLLNIRFSPTAVLPYNSTLSIFSNDPDENPVTVPLSGSGGEADIAGATKLDLGTVEVQTCSGNINSSTQFYVIGNPGFCDLVVNLPDNIGAFAVVSPRGQQIVKPKDSLKVVLRFTPSAVGEFVETLPITNNVPNKSPLLVALRGRGIAAPDIAITPKDTLDFDAVSIGSNKLLPVTIKNLGAQRLSVDSLVIRSKIFKTEPMEFSLDCNQSKTIDVAFMPPGQGVFIDSLLIYSNDPNGNASKRDMLVMVALGENEKFPMRFGPTAGYNDAGTASIFSSAADAKPAVLYLRGSGSGPDIDVEPDTLDFGAVCGGEDSLMFVTVRNKGDEILVVNSLAFSPLPSVFSTTQMTPFSVPPDSSVAVPVTFAPKDTGRIVGTLEIRSNDPDENPVKVGLRGEGANPEIVIEAQPADFGEVCIGSTVSTVFTIFNPSKTCVLIVDSVKFATVFPPNCNTIQTQRFSLSPTIAERIPPIPPGGRYTLNPQEVEAPPCDFKIRVRVWAKAPNANPIIKEVPGRVIPPVIAGVKKVEFGNVKLSDSLQKPAKVWNADRCDVRIDSLKIKGGKDSAFSLDVFPLPKILKAGDTTGIPVIFAPKHEGEDTDTLLVFSNAKPNPLKIALTGVGTVDSCVPQIAVNPTALPFGTVCIGEDSIRRVEICNTGKCNLNAISITTRTPQFTVVPSGTLLIPTGPDSCRELIVTFKTGVVGAFKDTLTVTWSPDLKLPPLKVPLSATGIGPRIAGTDTLRFGHVIEKMSLKKFAKVCNVAGCELVINALKVVGKDSLAFSANASGLSSSLAQDECDSIEVTFTPPTPGSFMATLLVSNNGSTNNPFPIVLLGEGDTCKAAISVTPDSLQFGEVTLGDTLAKRIKVANTSDCETLHVSNIVANTRTVFFVNLADRQFNLAPGASRDIKVYFAPAAAIFYGDSLKITSDDPKNPLVGVRLSGNGKLPYTAMPNPLTFPRVCVGSENSLFVTICNISKHRLFASASSITTVGPVFRDEANDLLIPSGSDSCRTIEIIFKPESVGSFHDTLTVVWDPSLKLPPLKVPLSGEGIGPQISGNKTLDFGDFGINTRNTKSDTVINNSTCVLRLDKIEIAGKDTSDFHLVNFDPKSLPININPNGYIFLFVEFKPTALGLRTAELHIWSDDPDSADNPFVVQLRGNGVTGILKVCKSPNTPSACLGDAKTPLEYTLCNMGKAALTIKSMTIKSMKPNSSAAFQLVNPFSKPIMLDKNQSTIVELIFLPNLEGNIVDTLVVDAEKPDTVYSFPLNGFGNNELGKLVIIPLPPDSTIRFEGWLDEVKTERFMIRNDGCQPLEVTKLDLVRHLQVFSFKSAWPLPDTLERQESLEVSVSFLANDYGKFDDWLKILSKPIDLVERLKDDRISLKALVPDGAPCLNVPDTLEFGEVTVGLSKTEMLKIKNCNEQGRLIINILEQPKYGEFKVPSDKLEVNQGNTQSLDVTFMPIHNGLREDMLKLVYYTPTDSANKFQKQVVLRGIGTGRIVYAKPNAFTPNDDGKNDRAKIRFAGFDSLAVSLRIFDLRGIELRYFTRDNVERDQRGLFIGWNGLNANGRLQLPGAYLWILEEKGKRVGSGQVVLIR